tara:strand:- start:826 stop:1119 length:294 start_codon:yes stop_codon:yes gene_type:complete
MAITKEMENDKIEVVNKWNIQVRTVTIIKEDGTEISRSYRRHVLQPFTSLKDGDTWIHTVTDISKEDPDVQAICNAAWTDTVKAAYKTNIEAQKITP